MNERYGQNNHETLNESYSLNGYHMSGITAPLADPNYDFYNRYARGLNATVQAGQQCVGIGSDNGLYNISSRSNIRAFKFNSDVSPLYAETHRHCLVETGNGVLHYLIPNEVVKAAYFSNSKAGKPPTLGGVFDESYSLNGTLLPASDNENYQIVTQIVHLLTYMNDEPGIGNQKPCKLPFQNNAWILALSELISRSTAYTPATTVNGVKQNMPLVVSNRILLYVKDIKQNRFRFKSNDEKLKEIKSAIDYLSGMKSKYNLPLAIPELKLSEIKISRGMSGLLDEGIQYDRTSLLMAGAVSLAVGIGIGYILHRNMIAKQGE